MKFKLVMKYDHWQHVFRFFRVMWERKATAAGRSYSAKLTFAAAKCLAKFKFTAAEREFCLLGLRITFRKSYGGKFV